MLRAFWLERRLTKREILTLYLRLAPFGGNLEGARAGALAYFGKEPRRLSVGEAAMLVALPQSPEARRPDRDPAAARRARKRVLQRMARDGVITPSEAKYAALERVPQTRLAFPMIAPHLADRVALPGGPNETPKGAVHRLTLKRQLQVSLEALVREHAHAKGVKINAALVAVENATGEIVAQVGSTGYLDDIRRGGNDMTAAVRSPGSALKPFVYGLAFEAGVAHPETLIEDRPVRFGLYRPKNFDKSWHGTVSVREALQLSLNIPAVKLLAAVGPARLTARVRDVGVGLRRPAGDAPSLALALGGAGLSLKELARLYVGLANAGEVKPLRYLRSDMPKSDGDGTRGEPSEEQTPRLLTAAAAWQVSDILAGAPPPKNAAGGRIAFKTGTSYGFRDAWAAGFDGRHTVAVWVGRADGAPVPGLTGLSTAAPLLFDAFQRIARRRTPLPRATTGTLLATNSALPQPLRRFRGDVVRSRGRKGGIAAPTISFPPAAAEISFDADVPIVMKAAGGRLPLTWLVDGAPLKSRAHRREVVWRPSGPGFASLTVIDADGHADAVSVRLTP